jgi:hypothetical protein
MLRPAEVAMAWSLLNRAEGILSFASILFQGIKYALCPAIRHAPRE